MGAFDQSKDQSGKHADQAKEALGNKRRKGAEVEDPEAMDPERKRRDQQRRGSVIEDPMRRRMDDPESGMDENDWT
jgi:hypothetical protein